MDVLYRRRNNLAILGKTSMTRHLRLLSGEIKRKRNFYAVNLPLHMYLSCTYFL